MMKPKVSIIVPVYNVEPYLEQCVDSIRKQTLKEIEIILVDDGSPDNCPQMCDRFAREDERIRVFHQENAGVSAARNRGIDEASAEWIIFVDSDDWLEDYAAEVLYEKAGASGCHIICASYFENYPGKQEVRRLNPDEEGVHVIEDNLNYFLSHTLIGDHGWVNLMSPWGKIYNKAIMREEFCYFPVGLKWGEDIIFNLYAGSFAKKIYVLDVPIYHYRQRYSSVCHTPHEDERDTFFRYSKELLYFFEKFHLLDEFCPYYHRVLVGRIFQISKLWGTSAKSWGDLRQTALLFKQISNEPGCKNALKNSGTLFMLGNKWRFVCFLLEYRMYWAVTMICHHLHHFLFKSEEILF